VETWNGTDWSVQDTPVLTGDLTGVSCVSATACVAVGTALSPTLTPIESPTGPLVERWDGKVWSVQRPPNPSGALTGTLEAVSCTSQRACTAVGRAGTGLGSRALAERWNGTSWIIQHALAPTGARGSHLGGVSCVTTTTCVAVGSYNNGLPQLLVERWTGIS
jgi:hypothetical protein